MKTSLKDGLDALARGLGVTGAQMRAVWDKIAAGTALVEADWLMAEQITLNKPVLDSLLALEQAPNRMTLQQRAADALAAVGAALAANDALIAANASFPSNPTNGQAVAQVVVLTGQVSDLARRQNASLRAQAAVIRLLLGRLDSTAGTESAGGRN